MLSLPSVENLPGILQQCRLRHRTLTLRLHAYLSRSGLDSTATTGNHLVALYACLGALHDSRILFEKLLCRKEWSWRSLIHGYLKGQMPEQALALYQDVGHVCTFCPRPETFVGLLKACAQLENVSVGLELHATVSRLTLLDTNPFIGCALVDMYIKCGLLGKAEEVFDKLTQKNVVLWTALMAGYVEFGQSERVLDCFEQMQHEGISPNSVTFICILKACSHLGYMDRGREMHSEIERQGLLQMDPLVGATLVDMYTKCGLLSVAYQVSMRLPFRNVVLWNILMTGYTELNHGKEALNCFKQLQLEGIMPDATTFVCIFKACGTIDDVSEGRAMHAEVARHELLYEEPIVGNALIDMYAKCGWLTKAQQVFAKMSSKDVVSWTTLIGAYTDHGHAKEALTCFGQMQQESFYPNAVSLICFLKACGDTRDGIEGMKIHAEVEKRGLLEVDFVIGNSVVDMYARSGMLSAAHQVCDKLQDVAAWNALIAGYAESGYGEAALKCLEQMQLKGVTADSVTLTCALKACGKIEATDSGRKIHAEIERQGLLESDHIVVNTLIDMYVKCGMLAVARDIFDKLQIQDKCSKTSLLIGYANHGYGAEALQLFDHKVYTGFIPDAVMLVCCLKAYGSLGAQVKGQELHHEVVRRGLFRTDPVISNTLLDMCSKCGLFAMAQQIFDNLNVRSVVSWTALIASYIEQQRSNEALQCLEDMVKEGIHPNAATYVCSLKACGSIGATIKAQEIHADIERQGLMVNNINLANTLVSTYAKLGSVAVAERVFDRIPDKDVVSWNALMAGYIEGRESKSLFHMLERMLSEGIKPDFVTFVTLLTACSSVGMFAKGLFYFEAMSKRYGVVPALQHHTCMINILGRVGQLQKAVALVIKMPFYPDHVVWDTVLNACRHYGDMDLAKQAMGRVMGSNARGYL